MSKSNRSRTIRAVFLVALAACGSLATFPSVASTACADEPVALSPTPEKLLEAFKSKDKPVRLEAAQQAKALQDDKLVPALIALLDDDDVSVRHAAIDALGARSGPDAMKRAAAGLGAHLPKLAKKLETEAELIAIVQALGSLGQPSSVGVLLDDIAVDTAPDVVKVRLLAVANIPTADAIEGLIQFLAKRGRGANNLQGHHCRAALKAATGEDRGNDPDAWRSWWKEAKKDFDFDAAARRRAAAKAQQEDKEKRRKEKKDGDGKKDDDAK